MFKKSYVIYILYIFKLRYCLVVQIYNNIIIVYPTNTPSKVEKRFYLFSTEIPVPNNPMVLKHHPTLYHM